MEKNITPSESTSLITEFKRKFSLREMYGAAIFAPRAMKKLIGNNKSQLVDKRLWNAYNWQ